MAPRSFTDNSVIRIKAPRSFKDNCIVLIKSATLGLSSVNYTLHPRAGTDFFRIFLFMGKNKDKQDRGNRGDKLII
jgi:hypothetical protein